MGAGGSKEGEHINHRFGAITEGAWEAHRRRGARVKGRTLGDTHGCLRSFLACGLGIAPVTVYLFPVFRGIVYFSPQTGPSNPRGGGSALTVAPKDRGRARAPGRHPPRSLS